MKLVSGARPLPIRLFAAAFAAQALLSFWWEITNRVAVAATLLKSGGLPLDDDGTIVAISVRLTIALIPIALVWFFASRFARWVVLAIALGRLAINLPDTVADFQTGVPLRPEFVAGGLLAMIAAALLFTPAARRWFAKDKRDASVVS